MSLDIVRFPDPIGATIALLNRQWPGTASAVVPTTYSRNLLVVGVTRGENLVTRTTTFTIECRDRRSAMEASQLGSDVASYLDAVCRQGDNPYDFTLHALVANFPDPDDGCPRSVVTCSMSWSPLA